MYLFQPCLARVWSDFISSAPPSGELKRLFRTMFIWLRFHDENEMISEIMTLITARQDIRYTTQVYALSGPPWFTFDSTYRCTITTIPPLIQCLSSNAKRNPKTPCTFLLSIFTWRSWKTKTTRNNNFKKWGYPCWNFTTGSSINEYKGKRHNFFHKPVFFKNLLIWRNATGLYATGLYATYCYNISSFAYSFLSTRSNFFEVLTSNFHTFTAGGSTRD